MLPFGRLGVPDGDERHLRVAHGVGRRSSSRAAPGGDLLGDELADPLLEDRATAGVDHLDLGGAHVHADHLESLLGEARGRHAAHVAQAEDAYGSSR
jgi:hypothetical protein